MGDDHDDRLLSAAVAAIALLAVVLLLKFGVVAAPRPTVNFTPASLHRIELRPDNQALGGVAT
jgi:hypothetical protein